MDSQCVHLGPLRHRRQDRIKCARGFVCERKGGKGLREAGTGLASQCESDAK